MPRRSSSEGLSRAQTSRGLRRRRSWRRRAAPRRRPESLSIPAPRIPPPRLSLLAAGRQELVILTHIALLCTPHRDDVGTSRSSVAGCGEWFGCRDRTNARLASVLPYLQLVRAVSVALLPFTYVHSFTTLTARASANISTSVESASQSGRCTQETTQNLSLSQELEVKAHFVRSREARDRVRLHEREQAVMQGLPRITERPTTRTPGTLWTHATRPDRDGARPRDPRERGRGVDRAPALYKWRSPVLPSGHAGPQSPERNHSALRTPRPPPGASRPRRAAGIV